MTPAPLHQTLRTRTVAERGIDTSPAGIAAVKAWNTSSRDAHFRGRNVPPTLDPTYQEWAWILNMALDWEGPWIRVWPADAHWDSPGYWEGSPSTATALIGVPKPTDEQRAAAAVGPFNTKDPQPWLIPWGKDFRSSVSPAGVAADNGCLIDLDTDGARGWELLGLRKPNDSDRNAMSIRTRPAHPLGWLAILLGLAKPPRFQAGDMMADACHFRTPENAGRVEGRGGGKIPKRLGIVTAAELAAGVVEHAISVTAMNPNHGPIPAGKPPCEWVNRATRCEHATRNNGTVTPAGAASTLPGKVIRNGQAYALVMTDYQKEAWLDSRGYTGKLRRTAGIFADAYRFRGFECYETCTVDPQSECGLTAEQWAENGVPDAATCNALMDGIEDYATVVALNPDRAYLPAA